MLISTALAQAPGGALGGDIAGFLLPMVLIFAIFYFLLIRPQQKRMKAHREKIGNIRRGDQIVTAGGILGKVTKVVGDEELQVEVAEGVRVRVIRSTVSDVLAKTEPAAKAKAASKEDDSDDGDADADEGSEAELPPSEPQEQPRKGSLMGMLGGQNKRGG